VWRIVVGVSLIPAFGTLYQRLTLPESTRYEDARKTSDLSGAKEAKSDAVVTEKRDGSDSEGLCPQESYLKAN
jgi:PHS family inorganic phosphate transporter-like MFS transporter